MFAPFRREFLTLRNLFRRRSRRLRSAPRCRKCPLCRDDLVTFDVVFVVAFTVSVSLMFLLFVVAVVVVVMLVCCWSDHFLR